MILIDLCVSLCLVCCQFFRYFFVFLMGIIIDALIKHSFEEVVIIVVAKYKGSNFI